jgi:hypothetical protein
MGFELIIGVAFWSLVGGFALLGLVEGTRAVYGRFFPCRIRGASPGRHVWSRWSTPDEKAYGFILAANSQSRQCERCGLAEKKGL